MELSTRALLIVGLLISSVATVDSSVTGTWDLAILSGASVVLFATLLFRLGTARVTVQLRADLARWIDHRAEQTAEPFGDVLDRSVAAYRDHLESSHRADE